MSRPVRRTVKIPRVPKALMERLNDLVELYEKALAAGGIVVVNPDAPFEEQQWFTSDERFPLEVLRSLAENGTIDFFPGTFQVLRGDEVLEAMRTCQSPRYEDRVQAVIDKLKVSESTARRLIKNARAKH